jgi:hypothetical protein
MGVMGSAVEVRLTLSGVLSILGRGKEFPAGNCDNKLCVRISNCPRANRFGRPQRWDAAKTNHFLVDLVNVTRTINDATASFIVRDPQTSSKDLICAPLPPPSSPGGEHMLDDRRDSVAATTGSGVIHTLFSRSSGFASNAGVWSVCCSARPSRRTVGTVRVSIREGVLRIA